MRNREQRAGDRRTFCEALHFLPVEIEVGRVAFLPNVNAAGLHLQSLGLVQTAGDEREHVAGHGVEEDVGVSGRPNADACVGWGLHGSSEERAEAERRTRGEDETVESSGSSRRSEGGLMVPDYIYDFSLT